MPILEQIMSRFNGCCSNHPGGHVDRFQSGQVRGREAMDARLEIGDGGASVPHVVEQGGLLGIQPEGDEYRDAGARDLDGLVQDVQADGRALERGRAPLGGRSDIVGEDGAAVGGLEGNEGLGSLHGERGRIDAPSYPAARRGGGAGEEHLQGVVVRLQRPGYGGLLDGQIVAVGEELVLAVECV